MCCPGVVCPIAMKQAPPLGTWPRPRRSPAPAGDFTYMHAKRARTSTPPAFLCSAPFALAGCGLLFAVSSLARQTLRASLRLSQQFALARRPRRLGAGAVWFTLLLFGPAQRGERGPRQMTGAGGIKNSSCACAVCSCATTTDQRHV